MNQELNNPAAAGRPTRIRYSVLAFACTLSMVSYLDRVCISLGLDEIRLALHLNSVADLNLVLAAFTFAYAAFEIPSGWLGDVFGPRNVLIRIVLWWSFFTVLTGMAGLPLGAFTFGLGMLIVVRFLFGMGEAGTYPNITRALHNWFPYGERGAAQGTVWMAGRLMGGLTPMIWFILVKQLEVNWRFAFWVFGGVGVVWCGLFILYFRNRPEENPAVNAAEMQLIQAGRHESEASHEGVPWRKILLNGNLWLLCLMYFCSSYGWYFNTTYLATYFTEQLGADPKSPLTAVYQGGPLWMGAIACIVGGYSTDFFIRRTGNRKWGRRLFGVVGHGLCAAAYFCCTFAPTPLTFFLAISLAAFFNDLTMGAAWATCQDVGKRYAAIAAGCMNTVGNLGGAAANWITGAILSRYLQAYAIAEGTDKTALTAAQKAIGLEPGYQTNFLIFTLVYVVSVGLWLGIDSTKPIVSDGE